MVDSIMFMPLGGGQRIGASCYYLRLGETNIILDAGIGIKNNLCFEPDFYSLLKLPFFESLGQINKVFISHAHIDHIGYLTKLMKFAKNADIYMTELTAMLSEHQIYDNKNKSLFEKLESRVILDNITYVNYNQTFKFKEYKVTFFYAGHIPGAVMILFEYNNRKILYTGDYSIKDTYLTNKCIIPRNINVDTLILCGLHAKHSNYVSKNNLLNNNIKKLCKYILNGNSINCYVPQLSKGIEFIKILSSIPELSHVPIYIDNSIMNVIDKIERLYFPILDKINYYNLEKNQDGPYIYITSKYVENICDKFLKFDFSLHDDFNETIEFIKRINAEKIYVVHCEDYYSKYDYDIKQVLEKDINFKSQLIFAQEKELYKL